MKKRDLRLMAKSGLDQIDKAVLEILIHANQPLSPEQISNELNIPRSHERIVDKQGTSYPTVRDSLFRLLKDKKSERTNKDQAGERQWFANKSEL